MTAMPMICTVGEEAWRQKEAKAIDGLPSSWGDHEERSILWEEITAISLINSCADIVVLRHPKAVASVKGAIEKLMTV